MSDIIPKFDLKDNIYRNVFESLVGAYNTTQNVQPNPHEVFLAAYYLEMRTYYWGGNIPSASDSRDGDPDCCIKPPTKCCRSAVVNGARADGPGAAGPVTARTQALEKQLDDLVMNQPNAYNQWIQGLDYFYRNVSLSLMYFTYEYKEGRFRDFYNNTLGLFDHPDSYTTGIQFGNIQEGIAAPATKSVTRITTDSVGFTEGLLLPGPYVEVWTSPTIRNIIWFSINTSYFAPTVLPIGGVTDNYYQVPLNGGSPAADNAANMKGVIDGFAIPGLDPVAIEGGGGTIAAIYTTATGPGTPGGTSGFVGFVGFDALWAMVYTDGSPAGVSQARVDCWQLWCAPSEVLADRWAMIYDTLGASWLFYYDLDGAGTFSPPVGLIPDNTVAIPVTTGMSVEEVAVITASTIQDQGFITTSIMAGKDGLQTVIELTYTIEAPTTDFDTGNLSFGVNYVYYPDLKGSDGSTLATGITTPEEYAEAWNEFKVPFETTQGNAYPYLNPNLPWIGALQGAAGGGNCGTCFGGFGSTIPYFNAKCWTGSSSGCEECRSCLGASTNSVFRTNAYPSYPMTDYNTPGNIFDSTTGRQANLTAVQDLV